MAIPVKCPSWRSNHLSTIESSTTHFESHANDERQSFNHFKIYVAGDRTVKESPFARKIPQFCTIRMGNKRNMIFWLPMIGLSPMTGSSLILPRKKQKKKKRKKPYEPSPSLPFGDNTDWPMHHQRKGKTEPIFPSFSLLTMTQNIIRKKRLRICSNWDSCTTAWPGQDESKMAGTGDKSGFWGPTPIPLTIISLEQDEWLRWPPSFGTSILAF